MTNLVEASLLAEIAQFQQMLSAAETSSAKALPGNRDYKAAAMSHWRQMIAQRQTLLQRPN